LRNTQRTTDTIEIMWDPADSPNCGPVLYYNVTIRNVAISCDIRSFVFTVPSAKVSNLVMGIMYTISVVAVNRAGVGMETTISVTTLAVATSATSEGSEGLLMYSYSINV